MTETLAWLNGNPGKWMMTIAVVLAIGIAGLVLECFIDRKVK